MKLSQIKPNPNNPRLIKDVKFKKLVESIRDFPRMLKLREIVIDKDNMIVGGNMRYKALQQLGYTEIPDEWIKKADDYTPEELREFIVKDNNEFGENDWDMLGNEYTLEELDSWGTDLPNLLDDENQDKEKKLKKCPECGCEF